VRAQPALGAVAPASAFTINQFKRLGRQCTVPAKRRFQSLPNRVMKKGVAAALRRPNTAVPARRSVPRTLADDVIGLVEPLRR
jgi:hypothetical protein